MLQRPESPGPALPTSLLNLTHYVLGPAAPLKALALSKDVGSLLCDLKKEVLKRHFSFIVDSSYKAG